MNKTQLKSNVINTFVKKECDMSKPNVQAAIISAAIGMAYSCEFISPEEVEVVLREAFEVQDDVSKLIGMGPQYVKMNIGFATNYMDISAGLVAYNAQKATYDALYQQIKTTYVEMQSTLEQSEKSL